MPFSHMRILCLPNMRPTAAPSDAYTKDRERSVYSFDRLSRFLSSTGKCKSLPGAISLSVATSCFCRPMTLSAE